MTTSQLDITNEIQEVSYFQAGDHKASINRRALKHNKNKTEITLNDPKEAPPWNGQDYVELTKYFGLEAQT